MKQKTKMILELAKRINKKINLNTKKITMIIIILKKKIIRQNNFRQKQKISFKMMITQLTKNKLDSIKKNLIMKMLKKKIVAILVENNNKKQIRKRRKNKAKISITKKIIVITLIKKNNQCKKIKIVSMITIIRDLMKKAVKNLQKFNKKTKKI